MTTTDPLKMFGTKKTHQSERVLDRPEQVRNNAGGFVFQIDKLTQFNRFLTMGTVGGTFYVGQNDLTAENVQVVMGLTQNEALQILAIDSLVEISLGGRALKQNPTFFSLAIFCHNGTPAAKKHARAQVTKVVRTGTHLFTFVGYLQQFGGWPRGIRKAVANWYTEKTAEQLAYQLVKYRQRDGYTHRDILRLSHPKVEGPASRSAIDFAINGEISEENEDVTPRMIKGFVRAQNPKKNVVKTLEKVPGLPWEALPDSAMNDVKVWDKMLDNGVPIGALLRQLPRLTNLGMLPQMGGRTDEVARMLLNPVAVEKSRIHPFQVLVALKTYAKGYGVRNSWTPSPKIIDALDEMFYVAFGNVVPTGKRTMNALDVSGSMEGHPAGDLPMSAREASAALAMVSVQTEPNQMTVAFSDGSRSDRGHFVGDMNQWTGYGWRSDTIKEVGKLTPLNLSKRQRLDDVLRTIHGLGFYRTDCSLPMMHALDNQIEIDTFIVYTDNETFHGSIHPFQALKLYRKEMGIDARLVVVSMAPTKFSIADPSDKGMLDISGFDADMPQLISDFSSGLV